MFAVVKSTSVTPKAVHRRVFPEYQVLTDEMDRRNSMKHRAMAMFRRIFAVAGTMSGETTL